MFLLLSSMLGKCQRLDWVVSAGGIGDDGNHDLVTDDSLNIYFAGWFSQTADLDPGVGVSNYTSAGSRDIYLTKLDKSGNHLWTCVMGGSGQDEGSVVTVDSSGNVYLAGRFSDSFDFDPGIGQSIQTSNGGRDVYVVKFSANGSFIWARTFGGPGYDDAERIRIDRSGNVIVIGSFQSSVDFNPDAGVKTISSNGGDDCYVLKLDKNGNYIWACSIGGSQMDDAAGLQLDDMNNIYLSGYFNGTCYFSSVPVLVSATTAGGADIFFAKIDSLGGFQFLKQIGGTGNDLALDLQIKSNRIYLSGYFSNTVDFDPSIGVNYRFSYGLEDAFIASYDTLGNFYWANSAGGPGFDFASSMSILDDGSIFVNGYSAGNMVFNLSSGSTSLVNNGSYDVFLTKLSSAGIFEKVLEIGGTGSEQSRFQTKDKDGNIIVAGYLGSTGLDFDFGSSVTGCGFSGGTDAFYAKYLFCNDTVYAGPIVGNSEVCEGDTFLYSVNAISDTINYRWIFPNDWDLIGSTYSSATFVVGQNSGGLGIIVTNSCLPSDTSLIQVNVSPKYYLTDTRIVCIGENINLPNGVSIIAAHDTSLTSNLTSIMGCDSIILTSITVQYFIAYSNPVTICSGNSYSLNGHLYSISGTYYDTIPVANSCDSVIITNITMLPINLTLNPQTVCENEPYVINLHTYNQSGVYLDTLHNIFGCDSIVITNLTVNSVDTSITLIPGGFISNQSNATYQWCECTINGPMPIPGKTDQTFLPDFLGTYSVIVTFNNCTDTSGCFNPTMVGLNTISLSNSVYAYYYEDNNTVFVKSTSILKRVELIDLEGRIVYHNTENVTETKLNTAELSKGLYILRVYSELGISSMKILIP